MCPNGVDKVLHPPAVVRVTLDSVEVASWCRPDWPNALANDVDETWFSRPYHFQNDSVEMVSPFFPLNPDDEHSVQTDTKLHTNINKAIEM